MTTAETRRSPNILITGTPGTGKSSLSETVATATGLRHVDVSALVKEKGLYDEYDEEFDSYVIDEDRLCDQLEEELQGGGVIVDYHSCDFFAERWFDLVIVLRTDNTVLYNRLEHRGYSQRKIEENVECEIMQVLLDEARESYQPEVVVELQSNSVQDMESNAERISIWMQNWKAQRGL